VVVDVETTNALISAGSGLVGAVVGAGGTLGVSWLQRSSARHDETAREARVEERRILEARAARERAAAEACDQLIAQRADAAREAAERPEVEPLLGEHAQEFRTAVSKQTVFLPAPLRARVDEAVRVLADAESVAVDPRGAREDFHYASLWAIADSTQADVHQVIAAWLQGQPLPERSSAMQANIAAQTDYESSLEDYYAMTDQSGWAQRREAFWSAHPELRPET
jgi:hypothetical protein